MKLMELKVQYRQHHFKNFFTFVLGIWIKKYIYHDLFNKNIKVLFLSQRPYFKAQIIDKFSYCEKIDRLLLILIKKDTLLRWIRHEKKHLVSKVTGSFGKLFNKSVVYSRGAAEWVRNKFWPLWWRISLAKISTTPIET